MPNTPVSVFISYAREESSFVDRLEADLQARMFRTWVDRRRLEGGQAWLDKIQQAIEQCDVLLVVLSPQAVVSEYVRMEYRHARRKGKLVIPLEYKPCKEVPMDLNYIQWLNFHQTYEQGLNDLLIALSQIKIASVPNPLLLKAPMPPLPMKKEEPDFVAPQPAPPQPSPDLDDLYRAGVVAKTGGDLERAYVIWQQILDHDPQFENGTLAPWVQTLRKELHPAHVKRLRERAEAAHVKGEWGQAIGAWEALLGLEPKDWQARENIKIARHNQKYAYLYENAVRFFDEEHNPSAAREQLKMLWHDAPAYGDPLDLGKDVKLRSSYSYWGNKAKKERQHFISAINSSSFWVVGRIASLLIGVGMIIGILFQSWLPAIIIVVLIALLTYPTGYRRVVPSTAMIIYTVISCLMIIYCVSFIYSSNRGINDFTGMIKWAIFATLYMIFYFLPLAIPDGSFIWKIVNKISEFNALMPIIIYCAFYLALMVIGITWWKNLFRIEFNVSASIGFLIGVINGAGLISYFQIWWKAQITYKDRLP